MWARTRKYFSAPIYPEDEEKTRSASLLNAILLIVLLMVVIFGLPAFFFTQNIKRTLIELFLVIITFGALFLLRRGYVRLTSIIFSVGLLAIVSAGTFLSGGFRASTMSAYIGIVIIAGILLGNWAALLYGLVSIAFTGWMVYANAQQILPISSEQVPQVMLWGEFSSVLIAIVGLLALVMTNLERAHERAKSKEKEFSFKLVESQQLTIWAQEASEFKSHLLARVSHELRTPLGVIMGMTEMLQHPSYGALTDEQKKLVERIQVNSRYLETTFTELLEQSQLDKEMLQMQATEFSPADVLARVVPAFRELTEQKNVHFESEVTTELPKILMGIPTYIEQILFYLLDNSVKFTEAGFVSVKLLKPDKTNWAIRVSDTGIGISKEKQELIFEPFRQVDESIAREYGGVGLGLSIVKRLATALKGTIQIDSEPGQGSTFTVTLPLVEPTPDSKL